MYLTSDDPVYNSGYFLVAVFLHILKKAREPTLSMLCVPNECGVLNDFEVMSNLYDNGLAIF